MGEKAGEFHNIYHFENMGDSIVVQPNIPDDSDPMPIVPLQRDQQRFDHVNVRMVFACISTDGH